MSGSKGRKQKIYFIWTVIALLGLSYYNGEFQGLLNDQIPVVSLSDKAEQHILYGDHTGGGHKHGVGQPCKSEFPENWNDEKILSSVKKIAANDNLSWEQQDNGYYVVEQFQDNVKVRVVMGRNRENVITAYPVNAPRNPCPSNDN